MSGPVVAADAADRPVATGAPEITEARETDVGGLRVRRSLPRPRRRTVGAWCFVDHFGPLAVGPDGGIDIGPHPHTGLQTVTYLLAGEVLHRDSLGSEQIIRPGQLNLMSAGRGVAHAEEPTGRLSAGRRAPGGPSAVRSSTAEPSAGRRAPGGPPAGRSSTAEPSAGRRAPSRSGGARTGRLHGVQLWVAQPDATRNGAAGFEHHEDLPQVELDDVTATVLVGGLGGAVSPARQDTPLVGLALDVRRGGAVLPVSPAYEHLVVVLDGTLLLGDLPLHPGQSAHVAPGRDELAVAAPEGAQVLLLGGEPFPEPVVMWWNFVGRSKDELRTAREQWTAGDDRFGPVDTALTRIPAPSL